MRPGVMDIVRYSFNRLAGKWGTAILVSLAMTALSVPLLGFSTITTYNSNIGNLQAAMSSAWITIICMFVVIILESAIQLGYVSYFSRVALGEAPPFNTLFSRLKIWTKALGLMLFMGLFTFLWMLLFIVPGIIAALRYSMAPYLMAEYPDMGVREAVDRSKELMKGNKGRLFGLELLLAIPTIILSAITSFITAGSLYNMSLGRSISETVIQIIVTLFVSVVSGVAYATFYMNLTGRVLQPEGVGQNNYRPQDWQQGNNDNDPQSL